MSKLIRISEDNDWIIDYDRERGMYRVSYFEDNHFKDECWFDAYEEKEVDDRIEKIIEKIECDKKNFKDNFSKRLLSIDGFEYYLNLLINWVKDLNESRQN